ncbi:MAG: hypothetical protein [Bacteriophage sp.]|nr:MAG: hypothetical protein [Bacteriophage sp.]UWF97643.1 MAG: hypothetical protein [Bacteriophage sp.]
MGFTTPCFIRKNTQELRRGLKELGYFNNSPQWTNNCSIIWAYQYPMKGFDTPNYVIADSFDLPFNKHSALCGKFIDCGTNEELFLAIAALRDDTDKYQWFTDGDKWIMCPAIKFSSYWVYNDIDVNIDTVHKATVDELIEHFKTKEEQ